jgi:hypothetical protein
MKFSWSIFILVRLSCHAKDVVYQLILRLRSPHLTQVCSRAIAGKCTCALRKEQIYFQAQVTIPQNNIAYLRRLEEEPTNILDLSPVFHHEIHSICQIT